MFCSKCGTKVPDGAGFCPKCGTSLAVGNMEQPMGVGQNLQAESAGAGHGAQPSNGARAKRPKKKKRMIIGAVILVIAAFFVINYESFRERGEQAKRDEAIINSWQDSEDVALSETYTNKEEGFSFKYPSAWVPVSEDEFADRFGGDEDGYPLVLLANEIEDMPEENTYIMVSKPDATQDMIDRLFIDDEQFAAAFGGDADIKDTSTVKIDNITARVITFVDKDGIGYQRYLYVAGTAVYQVDFFYKGESAGNNQRFFDAVIGSYKITAPKTAAVDDAAASMPIYNGIPIDTVIGMSADDVTDTFRKPDFGEPNFAYGSYIEIPISNEDASMSVQMDDTQHVIMFGAIAKKFELNGRNLNQGYDGLVETFGRKPDARQESDLLELRWYYDGCSILIGLDSDGLPGKAEVWKKMKKKEATQCVFTWIDNNALTEVFDYEYVDEGTPNGSGLEVYNFQLLDRDSRQIPVSVEKDTGELWAVPDDGNVQVLYEYYANNY